MHLFPQVNRMLVFPRQKCYLSCVGSMLDRRRVYVQCVGVTTRIVWVSGKLYKPGKISTQVELSRKAEMFHRKTVQSPLSVYISAILDSYSTHMYISGNKRKRKGYIFIHQRCLSLLYTTLIYCCFIGS